MENAPSSRSRRTRSSSISGGLNEKSEAIKVCVRIRPAKPSSSETLDGSCIKIIQTSNDKGSNIVECNEKRYIFDEVFNSTSTNENVYTESGAKDIVKVKKISKNAYVIHHPSLKNLTS